MKDISNGPYAKLLDDQQKQAVITALNNKGEKELLDAADFLRKVIAQIVSRDPSYAGNVFKKLT
jgi:hypothetical protein